MFVSVGQTLYGMKQRHSLLAGACGKPDKGDYKRVFKKMSTL